MSLPSISILLLAGCYRGEDYDSRRIAWLECALDDLSRQTFQDFELLVSINSEILLQADSVISKIRKRFPLASIYRSSFGRSVFLNFEMLAQFSRGRYICFWSDHDFHGPSFLASCIDEADRSRASLVCPTVYFKSENGADMQRAPACLISNVFSYGSFITRLPACFQEDHMGAVYGLWRSDDLKRLPFSQARSLDFLWIVFIQLLNSHCYFHAEPSVFALREKSSSQGSNHDELLDPMAFDSIVSSGGRFSLAVLQIIRYFEQNVSKPAERARALRVVRECLRDGVGLWNIRRPLSRELFALVRSSLLLNSSQNPLDIILTFCFIVYVMLRLRFS